MRVRLSPATPIPQYIRPWGIFSTMEESFFVVNNSRFEIKFSIYDRKISAAYLRYKDVDCKDIESVQYEPGICFDFNGDDRIYGIEYSHKVYTISHDLWSFTIDRDPLLNDLKFFMNAWEFVEANIKYIL